MDSAEHIWTFKTLIPDIYDIKRFVGGGGTQVLRYLSISFIVSSNFLQTLKLAYWKTIYIYMTCLHSSSFSFTDKFIILSGLNISQEAKCLIRMSSLHVKSQLSSLLISSFVTAEMLI